MDKQAIQQIQESANIPDIIDQVKGAHVPLAVVPDSMSVRDLEKYQEHASRYRIGFVTTSIADFSTYSEDFDQEGAKCFVDAERMTAKTIFDLGTVELPGHQENTAKLKLSKTAAYSALLRLDGERLSQKTAAEFIEDWSDNIIVFTKDGDNMTCPAASAALRNLSIEAAREVNSKVSDFGESVSALERIEAKHQESLPSEIQFKCDPYNGLDKRTFKLRVSILTGDDRPKISLRILKLESTQEEIAEEFKEILVGNFKSLQLKTFIGEA